MTEISQALEWQHMQYIANQEHNSRIYAAADLVVIDLMKVPKVRTCFAIGYLAFVI